MSHIVVTGYGRSGTTLLYCMLASTVKGYRFYESEIDALTAIDDEPKVTKRPLDLLRAKAIDAAVPDVKWIVCIRDPRSVLCSKVEGRHFLSWDAALRNGDPNDVPMPGLVARDRAIDRLTRPVVVRYEDLVRRPDKVQDDLRLALNLSMDGRFSRFHETPVPPAFETLMGRVRPPDKQRLAPWRWQGERVVQQFEEAPELFDILEKRGYESGRVWFDQLKETLCLGKP